MKERPSPPFPAAMILAILGGAKTQTRVAWPMQPPAGVPIGWVPGKTSAGRYGKRGDRLWVREAWAAPHDYDHLPPRMIPQAARTYYAADAERSGLMWRSSMHMPRWASRITLDVTDVRVQQLQSITRGDAMAEGCPHPNMARGDDPRLWFEHVWRHLNGDASWRANPWVWVIEFKRVSTSQGGRTA